MSMLIFVPTTVKLCRFCPSFFTMKGREPEILGSSTGWMSWKWLSTATTTNGPVLGSGFQMTRSPLSVVVAADLEEQAAKSTKSTAAVAASNVRDAGPDPMSGVQDIN